MTPPLIYRRYWMALGWALVLLVVWLSLTPHPIEIGISLGDKIGHLLAYACLMTWWGQLDGPPWRTALLLAMMGAAMEVRQGFTPTREPSLPDMLANALGVGLGWFATRLLPAWLTGLDRRLAT